jgi:hypothetical protein
MVAAAAETAGVSLTMSFERLLLSSVRLSSAATLFGVQQFESALNGIQDGTGFSGSLEQVGSTVNSLTQCLMDEVAPGKKEALASMEQFTSKIFQQSISGAKALDPRQVVQMATTLAQKSSDMIAGWTGKATAEAEEPQLATDVLGS